jgi:hypothetical protein
MKTHALAVFVWVAACSQPQQHVTELDVQARHLGPEVLIAQDVSDATTLDAARTALPPVLSQNLSRVVFGLTEFPAPMQVASCPATLASEVPITPSTDADAELAARAQSVSAALGVATAGGMRSAAAAVAGATFVSTSRAHFILLITSGDDACGASLLDAVKAWRHSFVQTVVVSTGPALDDIATAGGFQATCPMGTDAECGPNNSCDKTNLVCTHATFFAPDATALSTLLQGLFTPLAVDPGTVCSFRLGNTPPPDSTLEVSLNGRMQAESPVTWTLESDRVVFHDGLCDEIESSTNLSPVNVRIVETDYK